MTLLYLDKKIELVFFLGLHELLQRYRRSLQASNENIQPQPKLLYAFGYLNSDSQTNCIRIRTGFPSA
jgi:hypothetical protein